MLKNENLINFYNNLNENKKRKFNLFEENVEEEEVEELKEEEEVVEVKREERIERIERVGSIERIERNEIVQQPPKQQFQQKQLPISPPSVPQPIPIPQPIPQPILQQPPPIQKQRIPIEDYGICTVVRKEGATVRDGLDIDNSNVIGRLLFILFYFVLFYYFTNFVFIEFHMVNNFISFPLKHFHLQMKNVLKLSD